MRVRVDPIAFKAPATTEVRSLGVAGSAPSPRLDQQFVSKGSYVHKDTILVKLTKSKTVTCCGSVSARCLDIKVSGISVQV